MSYSSNIQEIIDVFGNAANSFYLLKNTVTAAIDRASIVLLNTDVTVREYTNSIAKKIDDTTNFADNYINYQKQQIEEFNIIKSEENINNKISEEQDRTINLYDEFKSGLQKTPETIVDEKEQLKKVSEEFASVQRNINSYKATADDLQKNADLLNEYTRLSDKVYGEKIKEENLRFEQRNKDLIQQIERAKQYAKYDKAWAGELERLETLAGYYLNDAQPYPEIKETEAYSASNLADLIKQAQVKALSNYDRESSIKLAKAFYQLNQLETYQIDLTVGTERLTIFGDKSIEDFIDKLKSIGLID